MVTKVEVNGYEIVIEEKEGVISVSALKDEEVVEEFELETEEGQGFDDEDSEEGDDVQGFDEFGQDEEEDFDSEEDEDFGQDEEEDFDSEEDDEDEDDVESKLESFQSFINKRK